MGGEGNMEEHGGIQLIGWLKKTKNGTKACMNQNMKGRVVELCMFRSVARADGGWRREAKAKKLDLVATEKPPT